MCSVVTQVLADGKEIALVKTSGKTLDFQDWDIDAKAVSTLALQAVDLNPNYWIHVTEVSLQLCVFLDIFVRWVLLSNRWCRVARIT